MSTWEKIGLVVVLTFQAIGGFVFSMIAYVYISDYITRKKEKRKNEM